MAFSLTPAQTIDAVLDFTEKSHRSIYDKAIAPLSIDAFDCDHTQLVDFMTALSKKSDDFGWTDRILKIPLTLPEDPNTVYINLLTNHAQVSLDIIREYELSYVDSQTRERQDMHCLFTCVMDSLSQEGRAKVLTEKEKYTIPSDPNDPDSDPALSGNLLLKVVLMKSTVDNRSGAFAIRMKLSDLSSLIVKLDYNIEKFNQQVKRFMEDLSRRGETSDDVDHHIIKAFRTVPVKEFSNFTDRLKDDYDNLDDDDTRRTPQYLMDKAENKFKILVNEGTWDATMKDKDELMAIKAELRKLTNQRGGRKKNTNKKTKGKTKVDIKRKPSDINKPVSIDGKLWYWCSPETGGKCNGVLRRHKPTDCKGMAKNDDSSSTGKRKPKGSTKDKKRLKLKAKETIHGEAEASDSDSEITGENFDEESNG